MITLSIVAMILIAVQVCLTQSVVPGSFPSSSAPLRYARFIASPILALLLLPQRRPQVWREVCQDAPALALVLPVLFHKKDGLCLDVSVVPL